MSAAYKVLVAYILLFASACADRDEKLHMPYNGSKCAALSIRNEYIVKRRYQPLEKRNIPYSEVKKLLGEPSVEWVEPNYRVARSETGAIRDASLNVPTSNAEQIHAEYAWQRGVYGRGIKVAIVDSGIDIHQSRLREALSDFSGEPLAPNGMDDDNNGRVDDIYGWNFVNDTPNVTDETGHGTHIAGIIAAAHGTGFLLGGIAPQVTLIAADFMDSERGDELNALRAIEYSLGRGAKIINNSWSSFCSYSLRNAFTAWQKLDVIFVNASGNEGRNIDSIQIFPSNLELVNSVTVGSVNSEFRRSSFSNYGRNVSIYAPGENIFGIAPNDNSGIMVVPRSGTSMAAPFVTGGLALAWSAHPNLSAAEIVKALNSVSGGSRKSWPFFDVRALMQELDRVKNPDPFYW